MEVHQDLLLRRAQLGNVIDLHPASGLFVGISLKITMGWKGGGKMIKKGSECHGKSWCYRG
jgi:hypothetical protein